ncbi:bifunctional Thrombospondin type-1 (TSP1) repeat/Thrombospondin type-1 (TSP1) repeat superfamily [Babesia duncani]|uniref:Bifunctional Thrombospondin type-1 (TSP1) repeat/Thrombospondin type-1 (TSP1) repeat superfamily n=1 Tax=Babesia duncani TaxID=323732 RepID=A0AAD9PL76_9APIC|nr:bifunctional Thrombospondin type-1 (TSP1) repeat/Thrombospondin type-1 (TSP1) repeat superfamily [Babesia duncani]
MSPNKVKAEGDTSPNDKIAGDSDDAKFDLMYRSAESKGLRLPSRDELPDFITPNDYRVALLNVTSEYEGMYTLFQKIRFEKLRKVLPLHGWNPFEQLYNNVCTPFLSSDIDGFDFDDQTGSCKCPNRLPPCMRTKALEDRGVWMQRLNEMSENSKLTKPINKLNIGTKYLVTIDYNGNIKESDAPKTGKLENKNKCNNIDVVLCSVKEENTATTQWSPWGGCSRQCGNGRQERFKINYKDGVRSLQFEHRSCALSSCTVVHQPNIPSCFLVRTPPNPVQKISIVNNCKCPDEQDLICSSTEALQSISSWLPEFRKFCKSTLSNYPIDIFQEELPQLSTRFIGRVIQIRFRDGFYFDCTENWGRLDEGDVTVYCKVGSPLLCRNIIDSQKSNVVFIENSSSVKQRFFTSPFVIVLATVIFLYGMVKLLFKSGKRF